MSAVKEAVYPEQLAQNAWRAIGCADLPNDCSRRIAVPINCAIRLFHRRAKAASRIYHGLRELLRPPGSGLNVARLNPGHRFKHATHGCFCNGAAIQAALPRRIGVECELRRRPDRAGVEILGGLQDGDAPGPFIVRYCPVERRGSPITFDSRVHNQDI